MKVLLIFTLLCGMALAVSVQERQSESDDDEVTPLLSKRDFEDSAEFLQDDMDAGAYAKDLNKRQYDFTYPPPYVGTNDVEKHQDDDDRS